MSTLSFSPGFDLTGLDFETGVQGRLYKDGVRVDASAVVLTAVNLTTGVLSNLPDSAGSVFAVTIVLSGAFERVMYYPDNVYFPYRVIPHRTTSQTIGSLSLQILENGVISAVALSIVEGEPGEGDWVVTGWDSIIADWSLSWLAAGFAGWENWSVTATTPVSSTATYDTDWALSANPIRNEIRFRIQDTGPTSFLFQDEEIDNQYALETATIERAKVYFAAGHLLQTKLMNLSLAGGGVSELRTDDLTEKFGLSEDGRSGETMLQLIRALLAEANRLNIQRPRMLRTMRTVRLS